LQVSACHVYMTYPFVLSWSCMEALSTGCTVVASRTGPVEEVITDGATGRLFDFFDAKGLARLAAEVLENPGAHAHLGRNARRLMQQKYDVEYCRTGQSSVVFPPNG